MVRRTQNRHATAEKDRAHGNEHAATLQHPSIQSGVRDPG